MGKQTSYDGTALLADGDANGDGNVNDTDLGIWQSQFGLSSSVSVVSVVPEPASLGLIMTACLAASLLDRPLTTRRAA
jgi:uncharacterized protein (DUF2141 family)